MAEQYIASPVIVFDGVCNVCSAWVNFVLKRDPNSLFRFASMQGSYGASVLEKAGFDPEDPVSFALAEGETVYSESDALIRILKRLKQPWPVAGAGLQIVPKPIRSWCYYRIARNRYRLFGKKDSCPLPPPELRKRFLL